MDHVAITFQRCANMTALLSNTEGWGINKAEALALAGIASAHVDSHSSDAQLRTVITNIRRDHATVEALRRSSCTTYHKEWARWLSQANAILRHAHLDWASDGAVHADDLAQIAVLELLRALPGFHYRSRFSTWAYQVITQGVQRHLRDMSAQKRAGEIDASVDPCAIEVSVGECALPETQVKARILMATV